MRSYDLQFTYFGDGTIRIIRTQGTADIMPSPVCIDYPKNSSNIPSMTALSEAHQAEWIRCAKAAGWAFYG